MKDLKYLRIAKKEIERLKKLNSELIKDIEDRINDLKKQRGQGESFYMKDLYDALINENESILNKLNGI